MNILLTETQIKKFLSHAELQKLLYDMEQERLKKIHKNKKLYHFTKIFYFSDIIKNNFILKGSTSVSFTRNKNLNSDKTSIITEVRIEIDRKKIEKKYNLEHYKDTYLDFNEEEERILLKDYPNGIDISDCIVKVTLKSLNYLEKKYSKYVDFKTKVKNDFYFIIKSLKKLKIPFDISDNFS